MLKIPNLIRGVSGLEDILPCHPQLKEDEEFSFWQLGLAAAHGLSAEEFLRQIGCPNFERENVWNAYSAKEAPISLRICSAKTGIPMERLRSAMLCELAGIWGDADSSARHYITRDPWLTQRMEKQLCYAGEFCPLCLLESPHFRLNWRLSLFVSCPKHGCLLAHLCGNCGQNFRGFKHLWKIDLSQIPGFATTCSRCSGPLAPGNPITPVLPEVRKLEDLHRSMIRNPRCISYFTGLYAVLRLMARDRWADCETSRAVRARLADKPWEWDEQPLRFERCEPVQRQYLFQAILNLFRSWPAVFLDVVKSCKIQPASVVNPPPWMSSAINLAYGHGTGDLESVREEFWEAAENQGWYEAAEILNGAPRPVRPPAKFPARAVSPATSGLKRATSISD